MGKFRCVCGQVISTSGENPAEWLLIQEIEYGRIWDESAASGDSDPFADIAEKMQKLYVCPVSHHVWIFWNGLNHPGSCYQPIPSKVDNDVGLEDES